MSTTVPGRIAGASLLNSETQKRMAKVHNLAHRKAEIAAFRTDVGADIEHVRCLARLTLDQFAGELERDPSQVGKWIRNEEPPQLETMLMSRFRALLLTAMAERTPGMEVHTTITVRRIA